MASSRPIHAQQQHQRGDTNLFGGNVGEDDSVLGDAAVLLGVVEDVGFADGGEAEKPEDRVRNTLQNPAPTLERSRV